MRKLFSWPLAAALAAGLGACAGGAVGPVQVGGGYDPFTLNYIATKSSLYTQIVGNPFKVPKGRLDSAVTGTMFGAHFGQPVRFSTTHDPNNTSPYRVVVVFNPSRTANPNKLCQDAQQPSRETTGEMRVTMAFCSASEYETSVSGRLQGVTDPNDPAFRDLIRQMTVQLFPNNNSDPNGGGDFNS